MQNLNTLLATIELSTLVTVLASLFVFFRGCYTVQQGKVAVITSFGKYVRSAGAGIHFKNPLTETLFKQISTQHQSIEIEFTATTADQANVDFKAMLLYATLDAKEETIQKVAFKFIDESNFMQALIRSVEGCIRAFVASKKQNEILGIREEIVKSVKQNLDVSLASWGYQLIDLQINDILFDEAVMRSMAQVVASENLKAAALNEGEATLIKETKKAEAQKVASILKGEGIAQMEILIAEARVCSTQRLKEAGLGLSSVLLLQWIEGIKYIAEHGQGNSIFLNGSSENFEKHLKQLQMLSSASNAE
jgi:regulator of protease activity HflC (stomatin/prohibitin superfamily)